MTTSTSAPTPRSTPARSRPARSAAARVGLALVAVLTAATAMVGTPASADPSDPTVVIDGRGWGHGRGMGQFGALGYARDAGWSATQILDHYYGGTTSGPAPVPGVLDPDRIRVDLVAMRGRATAVALTSGTIHVMDGDGATLTRVAGAVRLVATPVGMDVSTAPTCDGPWTPAPSVVDHLIRIEPETTAVDEAGLLQVCGPSSTTWYEGELWSVATSRGQRTLNLVSVEQYLRGVVPNEVPASWPDATLQAQAVAARSYVLAGDTRWTDYADTCDSTLCQVYDGRFTTRGGSFRSATHPRTDTAITTTAGTVRLEGDGTVARTEFSSSTGGWTAGGDFPAVVDEGDAVTDNPNARWRVTVDLDSIERAYGRGDIVGVAVVERNGLGPDGGRVLEAELRFTGGSVIVSGDTVRRQFGLKSNWFSIGNLTRDGVVQEPIDRQLIDRYVDRAYRRLAGRAPSVEEGDRSRAVVQQGSRLALAQDLVVGSHFAGSLVDDLYRRALGRDADGGGRSYWVETLGAGLKYEHLGTLFYGSAEYVNRSGGTDAGFIDALYLDILGRSADAAGRAYWLGQLAAGRAEPADVANAFYRSIESRRDRAQTMHRLVLGGDAGASLTERLAERLAVVDDLTLAAELAVDLDLDADL